MWFYWDKRWKNNKRVYKEFFVNVINVYHIYELKHAAVLRFTSTQITQVQRGRRYLSHFKSATTAAARLECATGGGVLLFQFTSDIVGGEQCRRTDEDG